MSFSFGSVVNILRFLSLTGKHEALKMLMLTVVWSVYKSFFIIMGIFISFKILVTLQSLTSIGSSRNVNIDICLCFGRMPPLRHARGWRKYCEVIVFYYILKMYLNLYCVMWTFNLSRQNYFSSTQKSILLLFRIITGDDWNKIMHDYMLRSPFCIRVAVIGTRTATWKERKRMIVVVLRLSSSISALSTLLLLTSS